MIKKIAFVVLCVVIAVPLSSEAGSLDIDMSKLSNLQSEFDSFSDEIGTAISLFQMSPAKPLGITGFDIGVEASMIDIKEDANYWKLVIPNTTPPGYLPLPKLHIQKGLPFKFDIGVVFTTVPDSNISVMGGELRWAVFKGSAVKPSIGIRGSYTTLQGLKNLDLTTSTIDLSISKGLLFMTPYAGIGQINISSTPKDIPSLKGVSKSNSRFFGGFQISPFPLFKITAEADFINIPVYSLKLSLGF